MPQCVGSVTQYLRNAVAEWSLDKTLEVPINLQGNRFDVSFMPEIQPASMMADRLCRQHASVIGVDEQTLPQCVSPVTDYLQSAVRRWAAEKTLEVSVPIEQSVFELRFMPERRSAESMATQLCVDNAQMLGVTQETLAGCISPVMQYLQGAINDWVTSKTVSVDLNLNNKPYTMRFMPERVTAQEMAQRLCTEQAAELGLTTQTQLVNECIAPVASYVQNEINSWLNSKTLVVPLTVQGADGTPLTAQVSFLPEHETVTSVAGNFCVQNAPVLGLTNENVVQQCLNPISDYLQSEAIKWRASRA